MYFQEEIRNFNVHMTEINQPSEGWLKKNWWVYLEITLSFHNFDASLFVHCKTKKKKKTYFVVIERVAKSTGLHFVFTFSTGLMF